MPVTIIARTGEPAGSGQITQRKGVLARRMRGESAEYFTDTNTWTYRTVAGEIDPKLFVFVPPKHAKRAKSLR